MKYSHIVDPATGMGLTLPIAVSVVARRGIDADSWSTALSVLGPERGMPLIERHAGLTALFTASGDDRTAWRTVASQIGKANWVRYVSPEAETVTMRSQHPYK